MRVRNTGVDLLRCILVYGICAYHAFFVGCYANGYESRMWTWCVPGFAFVSGYFGVALRPSKLIRLWVMAFVCFVLPMVMGGRFLELVGQCWYLHAYTILLLLSPLINVGVEKGVAERRYGWLIGVVVMGIWSWFTEWAPVRAFVPKPAGLGMLSFTSVLVAYVLGRVYRLCPRIGERIRLWWMIPLLLLMPFCGHYTSPVTLVFVITLFKFFEKIELGPKCSKIVSCVAASGFAVYLLHANWQVLPLMGDLSRYLIVDAHLPRYFGLMISSAIVWSACILLYLCGLVIFMPFRGLCVRILDWCDAKVRGVM